MIEPFNLIHIVFIILSIACTIGLYMFLKRFSDEKKINFLIGLAFVGLALHFIKQLFYWDISKLCESTLENICAITTVFLPFVLYRIKNNKFSILIDFMFFAGVVGGAGAVLYPTEAIDLNWYSFETLRFFFCHWSIFSISLLTALFGFYTPRYKNWWKMLAGFFIYEIIICANTALLIFTGAITREGLTPMEYFLTSKYTNNAFTFGPTQDMGVISDLFHLLIPNFMKYEIQGVVSCWPVVNLIGPSIVLFVPIYMVMCLLFFKRQPRIMKKAKKQP